MAFVRSPRGAKSRFSIARVSHSLSKAYAAAMGGQTFRYRQQIQDHAQAIAGVLRERLGDDEHVEWSRQAIRAAMEDELRKNAPLEVHEHYLDSQRKARALVSPAQRADRWDRFTAMEEENPDRVDPAWTIQAPAAQAPEGPGAVVPALHGLGEPARATRGARGNTKPIPVALEPTRRSGWLAFWKSLASAGGMAMDMDVLERHVLKLPPNLMHLDPEGWWGFWQDQIDLALRDDPRLVGLLQLALDRRERALVAGQHWLAGSGLEAHSQVLALTAGPEGQALYRGLWKEHMRRVGQAPDGHRGFQDRFDLDILAKALVPDRDRLLDWRGRQWLSLAEALWPLGGVQSQVLGRKHAPMAQELPQWAWMRTAMALSMEEVDPMASAMELYESFSTLVVIPSEAMLRQAGKAAPRFLEDEAGVVGDQFEAIHEAIHRAAVGTKWTGTVATDWRQVRAQGAPIAGRRLSQGPIGFMKPIHMSLAAQGRQGEDRPVTATLPLWHRDIEAFLDEVGSGLSRLQAVVSIPDIFFERLQTGGRWTLLDPAAFPQASLGAEGYQEAEQAWRANRSRDSGTEISAERLWKRLLRTMAHGGPFVTFEGSDQAFAPFPETAPPVGGIDGVGALPAPRGEDPDFVAWPSAAVDLSKTLDADGAPDPAKMRHTALVAMRMLDNAITLSRPDHDSPTWRFRPVCLGAVGFFEAINKGSSSSQNDPELTTAWVSALAEAWAAVVLAADQQLRKERGAAPAWAESPDARPFDPLGSMERMGKARGGARGHVPKPRMEWAAGKFRRGHRCSVRTVWAPYLGSARIAGVTPGGMGTLRPVEPVVDEQGRARWCPAPLLLELLRQRPEDVALLREAMRHPGNPRKWPAFLLSLSMPTPEGWERRLLHAAHIRPWIDQGVSLTLPVGLKPEHLATLLKRAWWLGLSNVRLEGVFLDQELVAAPPSMDKTGDSG